MKRINMLRLAIVAALGFLVAGQALAATRIKQNNADDLNLATSWDTLPSLYDIGQWDSTVTDANSTLLGADLTWAGIKIVNPGGAVTIGGGNTLSVGTSGIDLSASTTNLTLSSGLTLTGQQSWKAAANRTLNVAGTFTRTGAYIDFTSFNASAILGTLGNTYNILGPWAFTGTGTSLKYATSASGLISAYTAATADAGNLASVTSATDNYKYSVAATLGGSQTGNTLQYTGAATTTALGANSLTLNGLMNSGSGLLTITGTAGNPGLVTGASGELDIVSNNQGITINSVISGAGVVVYGGPSAGTLTLSAINTYSGGTVINAGTLIVNNNSALGSGAVTVNTGGRLDLWHYVLTKNITMNGGTLGLGSGGGPGALSGTIDLAANSSIVPSIANGNQIPMSASISGPGGLTSTGGGLLLLTGANTYTGPTVINQGAFVFKSSIYGNDTSKWTPSNITVVANAVLGMSVGGVGEFTMAQAATMFTNLTTAVNNNGLRPGAFMSMDTRNASAGTYTFSGVLADSTGTGGGAVNFVFYGTANTTLELTGANTYSGVTMTRNNGTLKVSSFNSVNGGNPPMASSSLGRPITIAKGTIMLGESSWNGNTMPGTTYASGNLTYTGTGETTDRVLFLGGYSGTRNYTLDQSGTGLLKFTSNFDQQIGNTTHSLILAGSTTGTGEIAGAIANNNAGYNNRVTKSGTGTWTLSGANTYAGVTTVNGGCLVLNNANALPGGIGATGGLSALTFDGGVIGLGVGNFSRPLAAAGNVIGVNFTGNGGWAAYGADRSVNLGGTSASITWATASTGLNGKILILGATNATHTVDFQNPIDMGTGARTIQTDNGSALIDGKISGAITGGAGGNLTKTGLGTLVLTGNNNYVGTTTVSAGCLLINGTNSGTGLITVSSGATNGGIGTVSGAVTFSTGAKALFTVTRDPVTEANTTPLTVTGVMSYSSTEVHLNLPANLPSGVYTLATSAATPTGSLTATPVVDSGSYATGFTSAVISLDTVNKLLLLTVNGLPTYPTQLAITSLNGGVTPPTVGVGFNVTVQSQDTNGLVRRVLADTAVTLSKKTGTGTLGGTVTGTILTGTSSVIISGVTYDTAESGVVLTATSTSGDTLTAGDSAAFTVVPDTTPVALDITGFPSPQTAGVAGTVTVTAKTGSGGTAIAYTGTVHFTSSAVSAGLPSDYTFVAGDNGTKTFTSVTLNTAGTQAITVTDTVTSSLTDTQAGIVVTAASAATLVVSGFPSPQTVSVAGSVTVTAKDAYGNTATNYSGTVQFTSSDGAAVLPSNYTFVGGDLGIHAFPGAVTLNTTGTQTITATDTVTGTITGTQSGIVVWIAPTGFWWTNIGGGLWSVAGNWTNSADASIAFAPLTAGQPDYTLNFNVAGTYNTTHNLNSGFLLNQLNFGGATMTLQGNSLVFTNNGAALPQINQNSAAAVTISAPLSLADNTTFGGTGSGQVSLSGLISGTGSLTKNGANTLTLNNTSTYTGGTVLNGGAVLQASGVNGVFGTGSVTLNNGAYVGFSQQTSTNQWIINTGTFGGGNSFGDGNSGPITLNGTLTVDTGGTGNRTLSGIISGAGSILKTGSGTGALYLMGANTYSGGTSNQGGILGLGHTNALGTGTLVMDGTTQTLSAEANLNVGTGVTNNIVLSKDCIVQLWGNWPPVSYDILLSGTISGPGGMTITADAGNTKKLVLAGTNTYTGTTTLNASKLEVSGSLASMNIVVSATRTLVLLNNTSLSTNTVLRYAVGATNALNYTGKMYIRDLYTNDVLLADGEYSSANLPEFITGTGRLNTGPLPPTGTIISFF